MSAHARAIYRRTGGNLLQITGPLPSLIRLFAADDVRPDIEHLVIQCGQTYIDNPHALAIIDTFALESAT